MKRFFSWKILLGVIGAIVVVYVGTWVSVLASRQPLNHPLAAWPIWPVACSTRGCITSADWLERHKLGLAFAQLTGQETPSPERSLTTTIRRHLVEHAWLRSPVTLTDARRYRQDILKLANDDKIQETFGISGDLYDKEVVLPLLEQEALREELKVESTDELYGVLAKQRFMLFLPFHFHWDVSTGAVSRKS